LVAAVIFYAIVWVLWDSVGLGHPAQLQFFRAAATVLPTLLVALAVGAGARLLKGATHARRGRGALAAHFFTVCFIFVVGFGEATALYTLGRKDEPNNFATGAVVAALAATFVALLYLAFTREVAPEQAGS
jgi:hypothetical protein